MRRRSIVSRARRAQIRDEALQMASLASTRGQTTDQIQRDLLAAFPGELEMGEARMYAEGWTVRTVRAGLVGLTQDEGQDASHLEDCDVWRWLRGEVYPRDWIVRLCRLFRCHQADLGWPARGNEAPVDFKDRATPSAGSPVDAAPVSLLPATVTPAVESAGYPRSLSVALDQLFAMLSRDLDENGTLHALEPSTPAWSESGLAWLVSASDSINGVGLRRIGPTDIDALRMTIGVLDRLDHRFGGGHARKLLIQYLATDVRSLLASQYSTDVGRALFSAVAEGAVLAAWMSYDAGLHGLAQRYFLYSLRLAQAADDRTLGCGILAAMSQQANFLGAHPHATDLARAAIHAGTNAGATPTVMALCYAKEARSLAARGDEQGSTAALRRAESCFSKRRAGDDRDWVAYFDEAELAAEFAHCFRDLEQPRLVHEYATHALAVSEARYVRSLLFIRLLLATSYAQAREPEQACVTAREAIRLAGHLKSSRQLQYIEEFRSRLRPSGGASFVEEFRRY
jgi:hypothetical protein